MGVLGTHLVVDPDVAALEHRLQALTAVSVDLISDILLAGVIRGVMGVLLQSDVGR